MNDGLPLESRFSVPRLRYEEAQLARLGLARLRDQLVDMPGIGPILFVIDRHQFRDIGAKFSF